MKSVTIFVRIIMLHYILRYKAKLTYPLLHQVAFVSDQNFTHIAVGMLCVKQKQNAEYEN